MAARRGFQRDIGAGGFKDGGGGEICGKGSAGVKGWGRGGSGRYRLVGALNETRPTLPRLLLWAIIYSQLSPHLRLLAPLPAGLKAVAAGR
jgi:hypothetical protein